MLNIKITNKINTDKIFDTIKNQVFNEIESIGKQIASESKNECPKDTNELVNSQEVKITKTNNSINVNISYNKPYAAIQHNKPNYKHTFGKWRYLADPFLRNTQNILAKIRSRIKGVI